MSTIPLAQCTHAPCRTSSKQASFSSPNKLSTASPNQLKYYLIVATVFFLISLLAAPGTAYSQTEGVPIVATGTLEVLTADGLEGQVTLSYFLHADGGPVYELLFTTISPPEDLTSGRRATVTGIAEGNKLQVQSLELPPLDDKLPVVGERRAVILLVDLQDVKASTRYTLQQITDNMYTGVRSVDQLYREASLGQLGFAPDSDNNGVPDVFGPFTINYSYTGTCDYSNWATAAEAAATQAGIDLNRYQHRVFVIPLHYDIPACNWSGLANVGCDSYCRVWIARGESPMVYAHELGHNLGMPHAGTDPENDGVINNSYGDYSDTMSSALAWHRFNAPHMDQMGWYADYAGSIRTITASGTYDLDALDATVPTDPTLPRIIRLQKPNNQGYYYLSYRQAAGYDDSLSLAYTQGVNIHRYQGSGYYTTAFIQALIDSATFSDSAAGIEVTQVSHSPEHVTVNISLCTSAAPTVTLSPASQAVQPGTAGNYTVTVHNQDGVGCPGTTFNLSYAGTPSGTLSSNSLQLGPGAIGSVTLQLTTANLASASYALQVQSVDSDGVAPSHATAGTGTATLIVDATAPTTPTSLHGSADAQSRITLNWNAATDTLSGVQSYKVYRDDVFIGQSSTLLYTDASVNPGKTYRYAVAAVDGVGNVSALSAPVDVSSTTACSASTPLLTLSPTSQMVKAGVAASYTVQLSNQDSANCSATTFTLSYSGTPSGTLSPTTLTLGPGQTGTATLQVQTSSSGNYTLQVTAADNDGVTPSHSSVMTNATFIADGTKPTTPTGLQAVASTGQVQLSWTASTDTYSGIQGYIVYRNLVAIAETTTPSYTDTTPVKGKSYTYKVAAKDKVGNVSSQSSGKKVTAK